MRLLLCFLMCFSCTLMAATNRVVNFYAWGGEIPKSLIQDFEQKTGIHVNFTTYDSNETLYAKLRASQTGLYDVILPSAYYVEKMKKIGLLMPLDPMKLPNSKNLTPLFQNNFYDPKNQYSMPLIWGITGLFYNSDVIKTPLTSWSELWSKSLRGKLMLLDDSREVFSLALLKLGYQPNDEDPAHIKQAYETLLTLIPNIKLFASDSIQAVMIDEDAPAGVAWNGDVFKAQKENSAIQFSFPQEGFVIWVDCLAIPKNPPHPEEAYQLINYLLAAQSGARIAEEEGHAITNAAGLALLPAAIKDNSMLYPNKAVLKKGYFQRDVSAKTLELYNHYWQQLKLAF